MEVKNVFALYGIYRFCAMFSRTAFGPYPQPDPLVVIFA
jgi:hypothetical protein